MSRLFFALWPDDDVRASVHAISQSIEIDGGRRLRPQNLHLTLLYLGEIAANIQTEITQKVDAIVNPQFTFELDGMAFWQTPKILCMTVSQQPSAMQHLVDELVKIVRDYPIFLHDRPYRAHVTLMRKVRQDYTMQFKPIGWHASDFALVASESTSEGIRYTVLQRWPLMD